MSWRPLCKDREGAAQDKFAAGDVCVRGWFRGWSGGLGGHLAKVSLWCFPSILLHHWDLQWAPHHNDDESWLTGSEDADIIVDIICINYFSAFKRCLAYIDVLVQGRRNSIANALWLRFTSTIPLLQLAVRVGEAMVTELFWTHSCAYSIFQYIINASALIPWRHININMINGYQIKTNQCKFR